MTPTVTPTPPHLPTRGAGPVALVGVDPRGFSWDCIECGLAFTHRGENFSRLAMGAPDGRTGNAAVTVGPPLAALVYGRAGCVTQALSR